MRTVLVTAASGNVGRNCVDALLAEGFKVIATARDPNNFTSAHAVEVRAYEAGKTTDFSALLHGIDDIVLIGPPLEGALREKLAPLVAAAAAGGVARILFVSGSYLSGLTGTTLARSVVRKAERLVVESGLKHIVVRAAFLMDNYTTGFYRPMVDNGIISLATGEGKSALVAGADLGRFVARALLQDLTGEFLVTGPESLDQHEVAKMLSSARNRKIAYAPITEAELEGYFRAINLPDEAIEYGRELYRAYRNNATAAVTDAVELVTGNKPMSFDSFIRAKSST